MFGGFSEVLAYRCMIRNLVKRDIRGRYKGSILGFLWNFILPLIQILVYILVFTRVFKPALDHYAIYLTIGMIVWIWFSEAVNESSGTMVVNSDMLKKIYFPRSVLPISVILSKTVTFLITLAVLFAILIISGYGITWHVVLLPVAMALMMVFILGLSLALSAIDAYLRDTQYLVAALMMAWIWLTPIMYARDGIDSDLMNAILTFNPLTYLLEPFQDILYWNTVPDLLTICLCVMISFGMLLVGVLVFAYLEKDFAEVL